MSNCKVCNKPFSRFVLNNKLVCLECDELTFDIAIEEDFEEHRKSPSPQPERSAPGQKRDKLSK